MFNFLYGRLRFCESIHKDYVSVQVLKLHIIPNPNMPHENLQILRHEILVNNPGTSKNYHMDPNVYVEE